MEHCNGFPTPTKVDSPHRIEDNGHEAKRDCSKSYDYVIGMILYMESNTRPYISFAVHQCALFTNNTKASHDTDVNMICQDTQGTKEKGLEFNTSKKLLVYCYTDADFAGLWGHENNQDPI